MATIDDILTTQKNGVVAINNLAQTLTSFYSVYASVTGKSTSNTVNTVTGIFTGVWKTYRIYCCNCRLNRWVSL
jgi:hypothetical protein